MAQHLVALTLIAAYATVVQPFQLRWPIVTEVVGLARKPCFRRDFYCERGRCFSRYSKSRLCRQNVVMTTGADFGEPSRSRTLKLEYGGSAGDPSEQSRRWEVAYKAFLNQLGKYLAAMSWEGHKRYGRGAIYANSQVRQPAQRGKEWSMWSRFGGVPTRFIPLEEYEERSPQTEEEHRDLQQIISRIKHYDAEHEFVIVFEAAGLMGTDVVKPSFSPPHVHMLLDTEDYGENLEQDTIMAEHWGRARKHSIDMTPVILDAMESKDSVLDITERLDKMINSGTGVEIE